MKWFVLDNEAVEGPFETEALKNLVNDGGIPKDFRIWGRVQQTWIPAEEWVSNVDHLLADNNISSAGCIWHFGIGKKSHGPMTRKELVQALSQRRDISTILLWSKGMTNWAPIFEFHDILEELGINRREHPRADIDGNVEVHAQEGAHIYGRLLTISEGGMGFRGLASAQAGDTLQVTISSDHLGSPINAKVEVRYVSDSGFIGCRFQSINGEAKSSIIQYIRTQESTPYQMAG
ncbi:MAG: hypothetical protein CL675_07715 [Bdellovibrionaceae bacterium]|nr:hypothetical protein [Pseudobdellovibrionaceae bacterium]